MISETRKTGRRYLIIGTALAIVSGFLVLQVINQALAAAEPPPPEPTTAVIYVAAKIPNQQRLRDLLEPGDEVPVVAGSICPEKTELQSEPVGAFQVCVIPSRFVPPQALTIEQQLIGNLADPDMMRGALEEKIGFSFALVEMQRGNPLLSNLLGRSRLSEGMREVSLRVDPVTSVGWKVRPGQRVDVVVSFERDLDDNKKERITELLLQDIEVVSVSDAVRSFEKIDQPLSIDDQTQVNVYERQLTPELMAQDSTVTLALSLDDALLLTHMTNFAKEVRLLLRNPDDRTTAPTKPIRFEANR